MNTGKFFSFVKNKFKIMKRFFPILLAIFLSINLFGQCREYIKAMAPTLLQPYVSDGNFFAPVVYEGDKVQLTRTFIGGQKYKILIMGMDLWQKYITIKDDDGFTLFQNFPPRRKKLNCEFTDYQGNKIPCIGQNYFEFQPDHTVTLTITVKIQQIAKRKKNRVKGCLGIVVGYLPKDYKQ